MALQLTWTEAAEDAHVNFIQKMLGLLRNDRPQSPFAAAESSEIVTGHEHWCAYPAKTFLGTQGLCAYYLIFLLQPHGLSGLRELIATHFGQQEVSSGETLSNDNKEALAIAYREEFGGIVVEITTNSIAFIQALDAFVPAPPPPWTAFPSMQPIEAQLNKQGSLEFWWEHIWLPFWTALTPEQQAQYLRDHRASQAWVEVLS